MKFLGFDVVVDELCPPDSAFLVPPRVRLKVESGKLVVINPNGTERPIKAGDLTELRLGHEPSSGKEGT